MNFFLLSLLPSVFFLVQYTLPVKSKQRPDIIFWCLIESGLQVKGFWRFAYGLKHKITELFIMKVTLDCLNSMAMHSVVSQLALISLAWNYKLNVKG